MPDRKMTSPRLYFAAISILALIEASILVGWGGACTRNDDAPAPVAPRPPAARAATTQNAAPVDLPSTPASAAELDREVRQRGSLTFRSFNGKWIGFDGDSDLTFLPGGVAHMFEYGVGISGYKGTYAVAHDGTVTMNFPTFGHPWPTMSLRRDAVSLLLIPKESKAGLVTGNRGGATFSAGAGTYWPFRPLTAKEEAQVSERMKTPNIDE